MAKFIPTILKNFASKRATRNYPFDQREIFPEVRGELKNKIEDCIFCSSCARKCPSQCITVDKKTAVWTLDPFACVNCGICVEACPTNCLFQERKYKHPALEKSIVTMQGEIKVKKKKEKKQ